MHTKALTDFRLTPTTDRCLTLPSHLAEGQCLTVANRSGGPVVVSSALLGAPVVIRPDHAARFIRRNPPPLLPV